MDDVVNVTEITSNSNQQYQELLNLLKQIDNENYLYVMERVEGKTQYY